MANKIARLLVALTAGAMATSSGWAYEIKWNGPGWYIQDRDQVPEFLFGGPYRERNECRAALAALVRLSKNPVGYFCTYHAPDDQAIVPRWDGPGWYAIDLVWQGQVLGGPYAKRDECEARIQSLARDPEFVASCWYREKP
jgi:hypothetical protein